MMLMMMLSIQKIAVFCGSYKKQHVSYPVIMSSRNSLSLSDIWMMSPEMPIHVCFCSGNSLPGTKWWQRRCVFTTSWRILWQFPTEISDLWCNLVHRFPTVTSHNLAHARHLLHLLTLMGNHYADHGQCSRVHHGNVYASQTPEIVSLLCHHTLAATWLITPLAISATKHKILYSYVTEIPAYKATSRTLNKQLRLCR